MRASIVAVWLLTTAAMPVQAAEVFEARLTMVPIDLTMRTSITGSGHATATLEGQRFTINGAFSGLQGAATRIELRASAVTGVRGTAIHSLSIDAARSGALRGELDLTPEQIDGLRNGRLYLQIASEAAPEGNLWGWFLR